METESRVVTVIPAQPGFFMLEVALDDSGIPIEFIKSPVVAWLIDPVDRDKGEEHWAQAILPVDCGVGHDAGALLEPSGAVHFMEQFWPSVEAWWSDLVETAKAECSQK